MEKDQLTFDIIGCAMNVHNTLGNGFLMKCLFFKVFVNTSYFKR